MSKSAPQPQSLLIRFHEAAQLLGMSVRWLQEQASANAAPVIRAGRSVRMRRTDVEAFARDGRWPEKPFHGPSVSIDLGDNPASAVASQIGAAIKKRGAGKGART